jgi:Zn-dependent metalloprotease
MRGESMKKYLMRLITMILVVTLMSSSVAFGEENYEDIFDFDIFTDFEEFDKWIQDFDNELDELLKELELGSELRLIFDEDETLNFITGFSSKDVFDSELFIEEFMLDNADLFGYYFGDFDVFDVDFDEMGTTHYRLNYEVSGIPVYGHELIVHTDEQGKVYAVNGDKDNDVENTMWASRFLLTEEQALIAAESLLAFDEFVYTSEPTFDKFVYPLAGQNYPVYLVILEMLEPQPARWNIFVDAETGAIVDYYDGLMDNHSVQTGVGLDGNEKQVNVFNSNGTYYLKDTSKPMTGEILTYDINHGGQYSLPGTLVSDTDGRFDSSVQRAAVDAHFYAGYTYDYFKNVHNRNSYDNNGATIKSTVHFDNNYNNAFWSGSQMVYGDGDGSQFSPLCGSLDVVAHELAHAVTQHSANLEYRNQSGALNESYSDVFGAAVEYRYKNNADWYRLAEDIYTPNTHGDEMRNMKDPSRGNQPGHMNDYVNTSQDNGGVHINSGIPNRAFYLLVQEIGMDKAEKIYYRTLITYLTRTTDFNGNRTALLQATADLYGHMGTEYIAVANTQAAVGIGDPINDKLDLKAASLTVDASTNTGNYTITITVPASNKATSVTLYEGSNNVYSKSFTANQSSEQVYTVPFSNKAEGTYSYKAVVTDGSASLDSSVLTVTVDLDNSTEQWFTESIAYDTPHYYSNYYDRTVSYTKTGASKIALHFKYFRLESGYDFVYVLDKNDNVIHTLTGNQDDTWVEVNGDVIKLRMVTDAYVTDWGYRLDQGKYYSTVQLMDANTVN